MAAQRELTPAQRENYAEGVRSWICGPDPNVVKALGLAMMLEVIAIYDRRLKPHELRDAVWNLLEERERATLETLLPLLTRRMLKLGARRERQARREANAAVERMIVSVTWKRSRSARMVRVRCLYAPRRSPLRPTRRARVSRTRRVATSTRARSPGSDGPSDPSDLVLDALGGSL